MPSSTKTKCALALACILIGCSTGADENRPLGANIPLADPSTLFHGHPGNDALSDDNKADALYPARFTELIQWDSPVRRQGQRGICSIFAAVGLMEQMYKKHGILNDPDFSEQYLQWAVRAKMGRFTDSPGSNLAVNLATIARYGIVDEDVLPYEDRQWDTGDDPACTGQQGPAGQPPYCYTNGEPPDSARDAKKWRLPAGRWINTNSIKAHMMTERTGVAVALEFFDHSWHFHRGNRAQWRKGFVTYPNDRDREESTKKPAGHAVLLVGWDDDLEVQLRDYDTGQLLYDEAGDPVTEKGFYIFKNSWGTTSLGEDNPHGPGYGFISRAYVEEFGVAYVVGRMQTRLVETEICTDGEDNDGDGDTDCNDSDCQDLPACAPVLTTHAFENSDGQPIPDNSQEGIISTIAIEDSGVIDSVELELQMEHPYSGDLQITLARGDTSVMLHRRGDGSSYDWYTRTYRPEEFNGMDMAGEWRLQVADLSKDDEGTLLRWSLKIVTRSAPPAVKPTP